VGGGVLVWFGTRRAEPGTKCTAGSRDSAPAEPPVEQVLLPVEVSVEVSVKRGPLPSRFSSNGVYFLSNRSSGNRFPAMNSWPRPRARSRSTGDGPGEVFRAPRGCIGRRHGSRRPSSGHRTLAYPHDHRRSRRPGLRGPGSAPRWHASTDHCLPHRRERGRRRTTWPRPRGPRPGPGPPCRCRLPEPVEAIPHTPPA